MKHDNIHFASVYISASVILGGSLSLYNVWSSDLSNSSSQLYKDTSQNFTAEVSRSETQKLIYRLVLLILLSAVTFGTSHNAQV